MTCKRVVVVALKVLGVHPTGSTFIVVNGCRWCLGVADSAVNVRG